MLVAFGKHPHEFAQSRYWDCNQLGPLQCHFGGFALLEMVFRKSSNQDVGVGRDLHRLPAQPSVMILFISSIESDGPPFRFKKPKASEIFPVGRAAFTSIRPLGSFSTETRSPGCTPRCSRTSLRSVT